MSVPEISYRSHWRPLDEVWLLPSSVKNSKQWQHKPRPPDTSRDYMLNPPILNSETYISFTYSIDKYSNLWNNRRYSIIVGYQWCWCCNSTWGFPWKSSPFLSLPCQWISNGRIYMCTDDITSDNWCMLTYNPDLMIGKVSEQ